MGLSGYLSVSVVHLVGLDGSATGLTAVINHHVELGPRPELSLPVGNSGERSNDQEWPVDPLQEDLVQEGDGLHGLPQAHLIRQDTVPSEQEEKKRFRWTLTSLHTAEYRKECVSVSVCVCHLPATSSM